MQVGGFELSQDLSPAHWLVERIHDFGVDVGSVIPEGFAAYVRLLHPASRKEAGTKVPVSWATIAAANDRVVHPEMQWPNISGTWEYSGSSVPGLWDNEPDEGTLPRSYVDTLRGILAAHTATPEKVWWCVWNGWGALRLPPASILRLPGREYVLLSGPLGCVAGSVEPSPFWQTANLWWPDDRAWCVATEIDFCWTYVGGSEGLIDQLIDHPDLEAIRTRIDHGITYDSDRLNPPPAEPRG